MKYFVILMLSIALPMQLLTAKSYQNQTVVNVEAAKETVIEIPYNQSTTLEFDQTVRSIWTSVSSNAFAPRKDKNLLVVSAKAETPVTVILADGSVYPLRLIPTKKAKQFAFKLNEYIGNSIHSDENGVNSYSSDIVLLDSRALEMFQDMYNMYFTYLSGEFDINKVTKYRMDNKEKKISIVKNVDVVEILEILSEKYAGKIYELQNNGSDVEVEDTDMFPFCNSVSRIEGYRYPEGFVIDSYVIPSSQKTGMFVLFRR